MYTGAACSTRRWRPYTGSSGHSERTVSYSGKYVEFRDVEVFPKPVQNPLPIYAPGRNPDALNRIARWGNGLFTQASAGRSAIEALKPLLEEQGRSMDEINVVAEGELSLGATHEEAVEHYRTSRQGMMRLARGVSSGDHRRAELDRDCG